MDIRRTHNVSHVQAIAQLLGYKIQLLTGPPEQLSTERWHARDNLYPPAVFHDVECALKESRAGMGEDLLLLPTLLHAVGQRGRGGLFIEMGAADGVTGSNTYMLEMCFNWTGLLIEGSPTNFELMRTRSGRRSVMVHSSVCNETHTVPFTKHGGLVSGRPDIMLPSFMKRFSNSHRLGDDGRGIVQVPCQPMNAIMAAHGFATEHFHYFSLDVEGAEDRVLEGTDATRFSLVETEELPRGGSVDRVEVEDPEKEARVVASLARAGLQLSAELWLPWGRTFLMQGTRPLPLEGHPTRHSLPLMGRDPYYYRYAGLRGRLIRMAGPRHWLQRG
jgi:FkbM family methyltransferase